MGKYRYYTFAALSGLLLALAYPGWQFNLGWLIWIGFVPLLWSLAQFTHKSDRFYVRNGFWIGFTTGLVYFLIIFRWFWSIYPLDTLGIQNNLLSLVTVLLIYIISSAGMAAFWGLAGAISNKNRLWALASWLAFPAVFVLAEYLRSWGFGFLWAGSGSLFGPHWTFGNLAYALADNPLALKLVSLVGIYGITFVIILANYFFYRILAGKFTKIIILRGALVALAVGLIALGPKIIKTRVAMDEDGKRINFAIIQTAQPTNLSPSPQETLANLKEQLELLDRVAKEHPESELVVFPEASDLFKNIALFLTPVQAQKYFSGLFKEPKLILAGGRIIDTTGQAYSRVFSLDTKNDILNYYDKRLLAPGGEFLPYPIKLMAWLFSRGTTSQFNNIHELNIGSKDVSTVNFRNQFKVAPMICSELLSPGLTKQTTQNSDVVVSMASYGIFHGSSVIAEQMLTATRFRAAESAKPIITATNLGRSYVIDSQGNIVFLAPNARPQILTGALVLDAGKSWYNKLGDLPIILVSLLLMTSFVFITWSRKQGRP